MCLRKKYKRRRKKENETRNPSKDYGGEGGRCELQGVRRAEEGELKYKPKSCSGGSELKVSNCEQAT